MKDDLLGVLSSTQPFSDNEFVKIDRKKAREFAQGLDLANVQSSAVAHLFFPDWTLEQKCHILLAFNAVNFSFYPDVGIPLFVVRDQNGKELDSATAAKFCLARAYHESQIDLGKPSDLANLSLEKLSDIFRSDLGSEIPMLTERLSCLKELGEKLSFWYEIWILNFVESWEKSTWGFVQRLVKLVPSFNDVAIIEGREVRFYKRAQLCAKMIHEVLSQDPAHVGFLDRRGLTVFADYRLPQILRERGILVYDATLADRIDRFEEIPAGSIEEISIRASTIWAAEFIRRDFEDLNPGKTVTSADVDSFLWLEARRLKDQIRPHHRTRTIYY